MTAEDLRKSILQQAIQGKLVPQDPNDEPAAVLLERIREEKTRLIKEKKIKKDKNESIIFRGDDNSYYEKILATGEVKCIDDEIPFEIPESWEWVRMGNITTIIGGYAFPSNSIKSSNGIRVIRISDFNNGKILEHKGVRYNGSLNLSQYQIFEKDILMAMTGGTVGKCVLLPQKVKEPMLLNQRVALIRNFYVYEKYIYTILISNITQEVVNTQKNSTNDNISMEDIYKFLIPLPSLSEQQRIVERLEMLLPLIEQYSEAYLKLETLNREINNHLKKSILQYAIQGNLVAQCDTDEPATELLKRINEEKLNLVKQGKLKKKDVSESIIFRSDDNRYYEKVGSIVNEITEEIPYALPSGWQWVRMKNCCVRIFSGKSPKYSKIPTNHLIIGQQANQWDGVNMQYAKYGTDEFVQNIDDYQYLLDGDVLLNTLGNGTLGRCGIFENISNKVLTDGHLFVFRTNNKSLAMYILYFLTLNYAEINKKADGSTNQTFLNLSKMSNYLIPIPPANEIKRIIEKIQLLQKSIEG